MPELIDCYEYVNADAIAAALSPFKPQEVSIEAGRVMLKRIKELANSKVDFAFETTMASKSFAPFLVKCKKEGYSIRLIYVWLRSADLAVERVRLRAKSGGHAVPEETIRQRYERSLLNFFGLYLPIADQWRFYDNSFDRPALVAENFTDGLINVTDQNTWMIASQVKVIENEK